MAVDNKSRLRAMASAVHALDAAAYDLSLPIHLRAKWRTLACRAKYLAGMPTTRRVSSANYHRVYEMYARGVPLDEIAKHMRCSRQTVATALSRVLFALGEERQLDCY